MPKNLEMKIAASHLQSGLGTKSDHSKHNYIFGHILGEKNLRVQLRDHEKTLGEKNLKYHEKAVYRSRIDQNPVKTKNGGRGDLKHMNLCGVFNTFCHFQPEKYCHDNQTYSTYIYMLENF